MRTKRVEWTNERYEFKRVAILFCHVREKLYFCTRFGEMAEWSIAAVLKTVDLRGSGGSNPSLSAKFEKNKLLL